jgi:predicted ester cyclase
MTEQERGLGRRWFEQVWNLGRREAIAEMLAPDAVLHEAGSDSVGPEGFYPFYDRVRTTLSDMHITVEDTIAEGDKLCVRWSCTAKHTGNGLGIVPTGAAINITGMAIMRVANGKLVEAWQNWDMLGLLEQMKGGSRSATYVATP